MKLVLFDWNGTLFNDISIWYGAVKETFWFFGKEPPTIAQYFKELEGDYASVYKSRGIEASRDELNAIYEPRYESRMNEALLFPGAVVILEFLAQRGKIIGLVTGQKEFLTSPLLNKFGIDIFFRYREFHVTNKKEAINMVLKKSGISPDNCCYIGDTPSDIKHAKQAGVIPIAFANGYLPEYLLINIKPQFIIHSLEELKNIVAD